MITLSEAEKLNMKRILIIGGNASGKTTLSKQLSEILDLPLIHLDKLYWRDNWQHATNDELKKLLEPELSKPQWIFDGNMKHSFKDRLKHCDTVFYLDFPTALCVIGAIKRLINSYNKSRPDMGGTCIEKFDKNSLSFIINIFSFNKNNRKFYHDLLEKQTSINVIVLKNRKEVKKFLNELKKRRVSLES